MEKKSENGTETVGIYDMFMDDLCEKGIYKRFSSGVCIRILLLCIQKKGIPHTIV